MVTYSFPQMIKWDGFQMFGWLGMHAFILTLYIGLYQYLLFQFILKYLMPRAFLYQSYISQPQQHYMIVGCLRCNAVQFKVFILLQHFCFKAKNVPQFPKRINFNFPPCGLALSEFSPTNFSILHFYPTVWTKMKCWWSHASCVKGAYFGWNLIFQILGIKMLTWNSLYIYANSSESLWVIFVTLETYAWWCVQYLLLIWLIDATLCHWSCITFLSLVPHLK